MAQIRIPIPPDFDDTREERLTTSAKYRVVGRGESWLDMAPVDEPGAWPEYFKVHRLLDAKTLSDPERWAPLLAFEGLQDTDEARRGRMLAAAAETPAISLIPSLVRVSFEIAALRADELPEYLDAAIPPLFREFPHGSLWLFGVDHVLLHRLLLLHAASALQLTPDLPMLRERFTGFESLDEHSLTRGIDFSPLLKPILLTHSPSTLGVVFTRFPGALVFLFGEPVKLQGVPAEPTLASLYTVDVFGMPRPEGSWQSKALADKWKPEKAVEMLVWWTAALNRFYGHIVDPRNFVDADGKCAIDRQRGYQLTFERMLSDAINALAGVDKPALDRLGAFFAFLDKAESLQGFGVDGGRGSETSGRGFKQLTNRGKMTKRLSKLYNDLPDSTRGSYRNHSKATYDHVVNEIRGGVVSHRKGTGNAVRVNSKDDPNVLENMAVDDYATELIRATRNSAHGLMGQLDRETSTRIVGMHRGGLPVDTVLLTGPLLLGFAAGSDQFLRGAWLDEEPQPG